MAEETISTPSPVDNPLRSDNDLERQNTSSSENCPTHATTLARATTFSDWDSSMNSNNYNRFEDDSVIDVETWNWPVLLTRVLCFFLLFVMIVLFGLGAINTNFDILASFVFVLLSIILINTYIDLRVLACRCLLAIFCCRWKRSRKPNNLSADVHSATPHISSTT